MKVIKIDARTVAIGAVVVVAAFGANGCTNVDQSSSGTSDASAASQTPAEPDCEPSYPDVCIPADEYDLDCADVAEEDFAVDGDDPYGFDGDGDGIGCESGYGDSDTGSYAADDPEDLDGDGCVDSYPDSCIATDEYDLDCADVPDSDFTVDGDDPYGFDGDGDGIGCESYSDDSADDYGYDPSYDSDDPYGYGDDYGDDSYDGGDDGFTDDYGSGDGYPVMCNDGTMSDSGGIQGACSYHGGVAP